MISVGVTEKRFSAEGACAVDCRLEVLRQPSIAPDPSKEPLDDPAPRVNGEPDLIGVLARDLHCDQRGLSDLLTGIPTICKDPLDEGNDRTEAFFVYQRNGNDGGYTQASITRFIPKSIHHAFELKHWSEPGTEPRSSKSKWRRQRLDVASRVEEMWR